MLSGPEAVAISMTDWIFVVAVPVALIAIAASIARYHFIAIIVALVGTAAIILDRYADFQKLPAGGETIRMGLHGSPVAWSRLYINGTAASRSGNLLNVSTLSIMGTNVSDREIKLDQAYFLCDLDGTKLNAQFGRGGMRYKIRDIPPLPPGAVFFVVSDPIGPKDAGLSPSEFLKTWATISFVAKYSGTTQKIEFDRQTVEAALPKP